MGRIAIIGSGISGLTCALRLSPHHDVTVFEAADRIGGHTHTHELEIDGRSIAVDTGFIVFNDWTYPNFIALLRELEVPAQVSTMSFSVRCEKSGLEYNGTSLNSLFAQRSNLFRPSFHRMIRDILRFNREAPAVLEQDPDDLTLGAYLEQREYSRAFVEQYILPMGAAIWSAGEATMRAFPLRYFVRFFANHGMLSIDDRPVWRVVQGGSLRYVEALTQRLRRPIRLNAPVTQVRRHADRVELTCSGRLERFDEVVLATHSDQALRLLADPTAAEREVLGAIRYQANDVVLHTDARLMPRRRLAWASWNYHILRDPGQRVAVTYWMNLLQSLPVNTPVLVSLNRSDDIDPQLVLRQLVYHHPVYTREAVGAQARFAEVSGLTRTHYCGAWWGYGFHEDGVVSGLRVASAILARAAAKPGAGVP